MSNSPVQKHANVSPPKGGLNYSPPESFPGDQRPDGLYKDAWAAMVDAKMVRSKKYQEQQWRADTAGAHPEIIRFANLLVAKMRSLNVPMFANEVIRSNARQDQLFNDGFSKAKAGKGPHPFGCAADIIHSVHGWNLTKKQWEFVGHVGKELAIQRSCPVIWGGDFKSFYDPAHWELVSWRQYITGFPWMPVNQRDKYNGTP